MTFRSGRNSRKNKEELKGKQDLLDAIWQIERKDKTVTLLFAAKDEKHNEAVILKEVL